MRRRLAALACCAALAGLGGCERPGPVTALDVEPGFPVVVVLIDALRADRVGAGRGDRAVTPHLSALAADGVTFRNAFASAPKTVPSVPQMFTSRYFPDFQHDRTLLTAWKDAGYDQTMAFIHNPYVAKWLGRIEPTFDQLSGGEFDARRLTDDAIAALSSRSSDRVALYVHYLDVHMPLRPPAQVAERFVDPAYRGPVGLVFEDLVGAWAGRYDAADRHRISQIYDAAVAATDEQFGRLVAGLREQGLYDRALVVVTADHGEELWDHGGFFHGHTLYDELMRVPLIVKFPNQWSAGREVEALARVVDILPTVEDLIALAQDSRDPKDSQDAGAAGTTETKAADDEEPGSDGASLLPLVLGEAPARTVFATVGRVDDRSPPLMAVRSSTAKLIVDVRDGSEQFFDLVRDPGETRNLVDDPEVAAALDGLRARLDEQLETLASTGVHVRLTNGAEGPVHYRLEIGVRPLAPFVNVARFAMEKGDRIEVERRAGGLVVEGDLGAGESDEARFDVLASEATIRSVMSTAKDGPAVRVCVAAEASCGELPEGPLEVGLDRLRTTARPPLRPSNTLQVDWWMVEGESRPIAPGLSAADRERLRALGYAE